MNALPPTADFLETTPSLSPSAPAPISRECVECGTPLIVREKGPGQHKKFCDASCRLAFANREKAHGAVLVTIAKVWRMTRGSGPDGKAAFAEMTTILDQLLDEDRKAGRAPRLREYVRKLLGGVGDYRANYMDRKRRN